MKFFRGLAAALALLCLLTPRAASQSADESRDQRIETMDTLRRAAGEAAPALNSDGTVDPGRGLKDILDTGAAQITGIFRTALRSGVLILIIALLCALADGMGEGGSPVFQGAPLAGILAVCAVAVGDVHSLMGLGRETIHTLATFGETLLPAMAAATAAGGAPARAAAAQLATVLFSELLLELISRVLIPLTYTYVGTVAVGAALENSGLQRLGKSVKGLISGLLTVVMLAFVTYLSLSGIMAGNSDAMTLKAAKMAMSGMVPVVGGVISDAADTVLASAGILRGSVGIFGMLAVLSICLLPFLRMGIHYLVYKLAAALAATVGSSRLVEAVDGIVDAFALELGMTASCAVLLLISVAAGLKQVGVA